MQGFGFLWCQRPVEGRFRPLIQAVYICIYMENRIYIRIIRRINTPAKIHIRCTNTGTEKIYLYIRIYTVRIYTAYIYLYGLGQPYVYDCIFDEIPAKLPYIHRIYMVLANPTNAAYCVLDACLRCQMLQTVYYTHACVVKCRILCTIV